MGWSAVVCSSSAIEAQNLSIFLPALALYSACINWTLFYDTIYAFQDKEHDQKMGLRSTAILFFRKEYKIMAFRLFNSLHIKFSSIWLAYFTRANILHHW